MWLCQEVGPQAATGKQGVRTALTERKPPGASPLLTTVLLCEGAKTSGWTSVLAHPFG